ncbi:MAG TPA: hypothetical protein VFC05_06110 [Nitrososphaeraceae archaeon]|nr:hypothetical protein [Nitrososphaeraceae archaeon]
MNTLLEIIIALEITLAPIVTAQISQLVNQIAIAFDETGQRVLHPIQVVIQYL